MPPMAGQRSQSKSCVEGSATPGRAKVTIKELCGGQCHPWQGKGHDQRAVLRVVPFMAEQRSQSKSCVEGSATHGRAKVTNKQRVVRKVVPPMAGQRSQSKSCAVGSATHGRAKVTKSCVKGNATHGRAKVKVKELCGG